MRAIGFIGLGHMGHPMANNLAQAGYDVFVYDVNAAALESFTKLNQVHAASSIAELAQQVDAVITSVQTGEQVEMLCLESQGLFANLKPNSLFIDCSSIDITITHELHKKAQTHNIAMLDAPVSGGVAGAIAGSLTIMVGGSEENFKRAEPILKTMGKNIIHAGSAGSGQAAKICNNLLLGISMIGVCEAFSLAEKLGLDPKKFFDISSHASGQCWSMTSYCPVPGIVEAAPSNRNYQPGFAAKMMLKDLRLGQHAAESVHASIPLGAAATELYELYVKSGQGETDFSGMINFIRGLKYP